MSDDEPRDRVSDLSTSPDPFAPPEGGWQRVVGRYTGERPGPKLLCIAGIHGNEPAGVHALHRVFHALAERRIPFQGEFVGLSGNLRALADGVNVRVRGGALIVDDNSIGSGG